MDRAPYDDAADIFDQIVSEGWKLEAELYDLHNPNSHLDRENLHKMCNELRAKRDADLEIAFQKIGWDTKSFDEELYRRAMKGLSP